VQVPGGGRGLILIEDDWLFSDKEASVMAAEVFTEYRKSMGPLSDEGFMVILSRLRAGVRHGHWEAETRGRMVIIVSGDMAFKTQSVQRLHEQFRHELFHLWIPNGVDLTGSYDWFYEGFALYRSLKLAVALKRIRFDDMLDTLTRANSIAVRGDAVSLIDLSKQRWGTNDAMLYARGMIFAFQCDVEMLNASGGKRSIEDLLKKTFSRYRPPADERDGNEAVKEILMERPELRMLVGKYLDGNNRTDWTSQTKLAGLEPGTSNGGRLSVAERLSGRNRTILRGLGYNNR
jgi:predicted metalloprotease with PDZ domain